MDALADSLKVIADWITQHITSVDPPPVPDDLAPHIHVPRKG